MRCVPVRSPWITLVVVLGAFASGGALGGGLGGHLAPDSFLAQAASLFAFPLAFFGGMAFWCGFGVLVVLVKGVARLLRGRLPDLGNDDGSEALVPPGYGAFVVLSLTLSGLAGSIVGIAAETAWLNVVALYLACGAAYGTALWWLAHHGYLPFPEPE